MHTVVNEPRNTNKNINKLHLSVLKYVVHHIQKNIHAQRIVKRKYDLKRNNLRTKFEEDVKNTDEKIMQWKVITLVMRQHTEFQDPRHKLMLRRDEIGM